jgi:hypothetical protein
VSSGSGIGAEERRNGSASTVASRYEFQKGDVAALRPDTRGTDVEGGSALVGPGLRFTHARNGEGSAHLRDAVEPLLS